MFADPQSLTLAGTAFSLPRVGSGARSGSFENTVIGTTLDISHSTAKRTRHVVRINHSKIAADPLQPATNKPYSASVYLVADVPLFGYADSEILAYVNGLSGWLATGTNATKFLGGES